MRKARKRAAQRELVLGNGATGDLSAIATAPNVPTDLLRTFVALYELRSFSKAAQALKVTQPAVSLQLKRLESLIGADLIQKQVAGVRPTEKGVEVLRLGRRMLAINDQIINSAAQHPGPRTIRIGIPNIFAPSKLGRILRECRDKAGASRLQVSCDHSLGLLRGVRSGYVDIIYLLGKEEDLQGAWAAWSEDLVWVRAPDLVWEPDAVVPLVGSPNLLLPDRMGMAALEQANRPYEVVFTAFDTLARRAAAAAGLGYFPLLRSLLAEPLVIEEAGVLPPLPSASLGIIVRQDLDLEDMKPLLSALKSVLVPPI